MGLCWWSSCGIENGGQTDISAARPAYLQGMYNTVLGFPAYSQTQALQESTFYMETCSPNFLSKSNYFSHIWFLFLLSLGNPCLWDFLSLFLLFPDTIPISWYLKSSTRESLVNCMDQILLQLAILLIILAASCMKKGNYSFCVDPAKRCVLLGGLKREQ